MANCSNAEVKIECVGCLSEMVAYIEAVRRLGGYGILENGYTVEKTTGVNNGTIRGVGIGRWSYSANIEHLFTIEKGGKYPDWLLTRRQETYESDNDYALTKQRFALARETFVLLRALSAHQDAIVRLSWVDLEMGCDLFEKVEADFVGGEYHLIGAQNIAITPENLVKYEWADDIDEAREWLRGE